MKTVLVTGSSGFIGKNLCAQLAQDADIEILYFDRNSSKGDLERSLHKADFIFHLAGVNRPKDDSEFKEGNQLLTEQILATIQASGKKIPILLTSSIQAGLDNAYGTSKRAAEDAVFAFAKSTGAKAYIYRLPNVFGKWCQPNYNSVVATFCNNIANGLPVTVSDPATELNLVYIDDVVREFIAALKGEATPASDRYCYVPEVSKITLGELVTRLKDFKQSRDSLVMSNLEDSLSRNLYATYTSYLAEDDFSYALQKSSDNRGWLAEFIKSKQFGQVFISRTKPGISRGNHWHNTKIEKFLVIEGKAEITFRKVGEQEHVVRYPVSGDELTVVDIPAGYVHAIKNTGDTDLLTIFWADEILDKDRPDTIYESVEGGDTQA